MRFLKIILHLNLSLLTDYYNILNLSKFDKSSGFEHKGIWHDIGNAERLKLVEKLFPNN